MDVYLRQIVDYLITQSWQIAVLVVVIAAVSLALKNKKRTHPLPALANCSGQMSAAALAHNTLGDSSTASTNRTDSGFPAV